MVRSRSDISQQLPLSLSPRSDETDVSTDRRIQWLAVVDEARRLTDASRGIDRFLRDARISDPDADRRRTAKELTEAVRALLVLGDRKDVEPTVSAETLGVVCFHAVATAPFDRRAVVQGHTIHATDADWQFGRGPALEGTALEITRFLLALSDVAPRRAS